MDDQQDPGRSKRAPRAAGHDLPMLRVHRALEVAREIAKERGIANQDAHDIAQAVIGIIGEGTSRWGQLCTQCRSVISWEQGRPQCPTHGDLGAGFMGRSPVMALLIAFDPVVPAPAPQPADA